MANKVKMGLGDAIKRLLEVEMSFRTGTNVDTSRQERDLILIALNKMQIDVGFDCDGDGVPDVTNVMDIFQVSAETSCCRIDNRKDTSRAKKKEEDPKTQTTQEPALEKEKRSVLGKIFKR